MNLQNFIKDVPDYPKPGVVFKDITPLLSNSEAFKFSIKQIAEKYHYLNNDLNNDKKIHKVLGIDARGFIFASPVACELNAGLAIVRKPGKLPCATIKESYDLEYGSNCLEIHEDAIKPGENVLIVDDVLATGGTMEATCKLVEKLGGKIVGIEFLIELSFLSGREKLSKYNIDSLLNY